MFKWKNSSKAKAACPALLTFLFVFSLTACGGWGDKASAEPFQELYYQGIGRYAGVYSPMTAFTTMSSTVMTRRLVQYQIGIPCLYPIAMAVCISVKANMTSIRMAL